MRDLAISFTLLLSILSQNAQSEVGNNLDALNDPCQLETVELDWETLKERILETIIFKTADDKIFSLLSSNYHLSTTLCQPKNPTNNSNYVNNCVCSPSIHEKKTNAIPVISPDNEHLMVTLDYFEALGCSCLLPEFVGETFPIITDVTFTKSALLEDDSCQRKNVELDWETLKKYILETEILTTHYDKTALRLSVSNNQLSTTLCHPKNLMNSSAVGNNCICLPSIQEQKTMAFPIVSGDNEKLVVTLDYWEALECSCQSQKSVGWIFPNITYVSVVRSFVNSSEEAEPDLLEVDPCQLGTVELDWEALKKHILDTVTLTSNDDKTALHLSKSDSQLSTTVCHPKNLMNNSTDGKNCVCSPSIQEYKTMAFPIVSENNKNLVVTLNYLEALECSCLHPKSVSETFPIITDVTVSGSFVYSSKQAEPAPLGDDPCQLETVKLDWGTLKERILDTSFFLTDDDRTTLPLSLSNNQLSTTFCQPKNPSGNNCVCSPSLHEKKTIAFPVVSAINKHLVVTLDYLEASGCSCLPPNFVGEIFPIITDVTVARSFNNSNEQTKQVVVGKGETASMKFPYCSNINDNIPTKFTIFRSFDPSQFIGIRVLRGITRIFSSNGPSDWRAKSRVTFHHNDNFLKLNLKTVNRDDEGTYLCTQEVFGSSPCFSSVELKLDVEPTKIIYRPEATSISWPSILKSAAEFAGNNSFIADSSNVDSIQVYKCRSNHKICEAPNLQCISDSNSKKQVKQCLWHSDGRPEQYEIDYEEDEMCSSAIKDPFPKRSFMTDARKQIRVTNVTRGNCSSEIINMIVLDRRCRPQTTSIGWESFYRSAAELAGNVSFIAKSSDINKIKVRKCRSHPRACEATYRQCVSASTSKKQLKVCLWDTDGKPEQYEIDYEEDESCSCAIKQPLRKRSLMTDAPEISITNVKRGTCFNPCTPEYINVPWEKIKSRINQWTFLSLTSKMEGPDLRMKRCHQSLSPCNIEGTYCDVRKDKITSKTLKLKNYDIKIRIKYYEAVSCECRQSTNMTYDVEGDTAHDSPVLTYVKAKKTKKRKIKEPKMERSEREKKKKERKRKRKERNKVKSN